MSILQVKPAFSGSSGYSAVNMNNIPPWHSGGIDNKNNWWYTNGNNDFFLYSISGLTYYTQVGMNRSDFASARFLTETYEILNERLNEDGSVSADIKISLSTYSGRRTDYAGAGVQVHTQLYFGNSKIGDFQGMTNEPSDIHASPNPITIPITIGPQETAENTKLKISYTYPNGEYTNSVMYLGGVVYNPTPPNYKPMSIRKNGVYKSLDKNNGFIKIRKSNSYVDKTTESKGTQLQSNKGHNRIRRSGSWLQLPPMK